MDRPPCETCPHFKVFGSAITNDLSRQCWLEPPTSHAFIVPTQVRGTAAITTAFSVPTVPPGYGCSHHPDFPRYLAERDRTAGERAAELELIHAQVALED
jgi:hypothetical protein